MYNLRYCATCQCRTVFSEAVCKGSFPVIPNGMFSQEEKAVAIRTKVFAFFLSVFVFPTLSHSQPPDAPVVVSPVVEREVKKPLKLIGATSPARRSLISSEVKGIVGKMNVEEGRYVKKGEILAEIKNDKIRLNLEQLRSDMKEVAARAELSKKNLVRMEELYDKGIISEGEFDRAKAQRESDRAELLSLKKGVEIAQYDLAVSRIAAPFNGYVTTHHAEAGQWLDIGDEVVSLVDIDTIEVMAGIPERYIDDISEGMEVKVVLVSHKRRVVSGKIFSVIPEADPRAVSFPIKVVLENPDHSIKASASAVIMLAVGENEKIKLVPKDSIVDSPQGSMVFAVREGLAHPVPIQRKGSYEGFTHVEGDIAVGESVVVRGNERLRPMQKVRVAGTVEQ